MFIQDPDVGVKCIVIRGLRSSQALTLGCFVGGVVVGHDVQLDPGVGLGDEFEEVQELGVGVSLVAGVGDLSGGYLHGREQRCGAVADIVAGRLLRQPGS